MRVAAVTGMVASTNIIEAIIFTAFISFNAALVLNALGVFTIQGKNLPGDMCCGVAITGLTRILWITALTQKTILAHTKLANNSIDVGSRANEALTRIPRVTALTGITYASITSLRQVVGFQQHCVSIAHSYLARSWQKGYVSRRLTCTAASNLQAALRRYSV
jgi:hypothetical protein